MAVIWNRPTATDLSGFYNLHSVILLSLPKSVYALQTGHTISIQYTLVPGTVLGTLHAYTQQDRFMTTDLNDVSSQETSFL